MSIDLEPSEPEIKNRVFGRIYTITRDGKEVAYCAFTDEAFKHLVLAAPDLFAACDALLKAMYEIDLRSDARKHDLENCSDLSIIEPYPMPIDRTRKDLVAFSRWAVTGLYRAVPWEEYRV